MCNDLTPSTTSVPSAEVLEQTLRDLLQQAPLPAAATAGPGRPPVLPAGVLWLALLVGLLRGFTVQCDIWRLLTQHGLWHFPRYALTDMGFYQRCARTPATALQELFAHLTTLLQQRYPHHSRGADVAGRPLAAFAAGIFAFDHTILDAVTRKLKWLRGVPAGDDRLLPGALGCCFDLRRQQWTRVLFTAQTTGNLALSGTATAAALLVGLPPGSLVLVDLGFFSFAWFDALTAQGYWYVTRLKEKVTYEVQHVFYHGSHGGVTVRDCLIYLGKHRADRAAHPVRLIELTLGTQRRTYLTNVLDPRLLPVWEVAELYRRRWNIEQAFDQLKTHLGLHLLWSAATNLVQQQVFATLIIAQIVLALRAEVAHASGAEVREVSVPLLLRWLPRLAAMGHDPLAEFIATGREAGYIRPFRGKQWLVPEIPLTEYTFPAPPLPSRPARYGSRDYERRKQAETGQSRRQRRKTAGEAEV
jgi:hypothetical protein